MEASFWKLSWARDCRNLGERSWWSRGHENESLCYTFCKLKSVARKQLSGGSPFSSTMLVLFCVSFLQGRLPDSIGSVLAQNVDLALQTHWLQIAFSKGVSFRACLGKVWKLACFNIWEVHRNTTAFYIPAQLFDHGQKILGDCEDREEDTVQVSSGNMLYDLC